MMRKNVSISGDCNIYCTFESFDDPRSIIHFSFPSFTVSVKCARGEEAFCQALEPPIVKTEWACAPGWGVYPLEDGIVLVLISGIRLYLT